MFFENVFAFGIIVIQVPAVSLDVPSTLQEPCRSPCIRNALFRGYEKDFVLQGHVLVKINVSSPLDCALKCIEESRCQSVNFEHVTDKPTLLCELNHETRATKPAFYVKKTGFIYHDAMGPGSGWCGSVCSSLYKNVICPEGFAGSECQFPMKSCKDWLNHGFSNDGIYHILLNSYKPFQIYCDQTTDGGGWALIQRRQEGTVDFFRGWEDYKTGFGDLMGEFWLGNDLIHLASSFSGVTELRVEIETFQGYKAFAKYNRFSISNEKDNYTLSVSGYTGTAGDSFGTESGNNISVTINNGMAFSTWDNDNDNHAHDGSCALDWKGAWWFNGCYWSHLNGPYRKQGQDFGINWYSFDASNFKSLKRCSMGIRPAA